MSKYNRKFIVRYRQFERWHNMNEKPHGLSLCLNVLIAVHLLTFRP